MKAETPTRGLTQTQAKLAERSIILLCAAALAMIFQPFSSTLYAIGLGLTVLGGLAFNLVPLCTPGQKPRRLLTAAATVIGILILVVLVALGSAELYAIHLGRR